MSCVFSWVNDAGISNNYGVIWNVEIYKTIWGDQYITANGDFADNGCIDTYRDAVSYGWCAHSLTTIFTTNSGTFVQVDVFSENYALCDCDIIWMA